MTSKRYRLIIPQPGHEADRDVVAEILFHKKPGDKRITWESAVVADSLPSKVFDTYTSILNEVGNRRHRRVQTHYQLILGNKHHAGAKVVAEFTCQASRRNRLQVETQLTPGTRTKDELGTLTVLAYLGATYRKAEQEETK